MTPVPVVHAERVLHPDRVPVGRGGDLLGGHAEGRALEAGDDRQAEVGVQWIARRLERRGRSRPDSPAAVMSSAALARSIVVAAVVSASSMNGSSIATQASGEAKASPA